MPSTGPDGVTGSGPALAGHRRLLHGWGATAPTAADVVRPPSAPRLTHALDDAPMRGAIARGLGRSYGDAAQNAGGRVVDTTGVCDFELDAATGTVRASAGATLDDLLRELVPLGWFVPVSPGTRYVTVGGAVASDIHGKNHHRTGSWCHHVERLTLAMPDGSTTVVSPDDDPDLFWATAGGMGLTGVIVEATFRCLPIETSRLLVDTDRTRDLDEVMALMDEGDADYDFSVAWVDITTGGAALGRSVLTRGRFAAAAEVPGDEVARRAYDPTVLVTAPPVAPSGLLNRATIRAFNELWYRKAPRQRRDELQTIPTFWHPLDMVDGWNRAYGRRGFVQWQCAVPFGAEHVVHHAVERFSSGGYPSFVTVLKRFGPGNPGPLSFPIEGWTLAVDIPVGRAGLARTLDRLDDQVAAAGGRIYLAKDSRLRRELLPAMYPRLDEWRAVRSRVDPEHRLQSDLARRLDLL
jgi:decaprenylphospho-beta-D-ribofuranose 2-oxidase